MRPVPGTVATYCNMVALPLAGIRLSCGLWAVVSGEAWRGGFGKTTLAGVDRLDQLFARSLREIQAHAGEPAQTETGGFLINEAAQLLAALRLWAQTQFRSDQAVRDMLEALDEAALERVAADLRALSSTDSRAAGGTVTATMRLPREQLMAIASYALRAL